MRVEFKQLETVSDPRGHLVSIEVGRNIPFPVRRVYYIYGNKEGKPRGYHAHKRVKQALICLNGRLKVGVDDGKTRTVYELKSPRELLIIPEMIWRVMYGFSPDAILLVLADQHYDEADYIRDYEAFLHAVREKTPPGGVPR